MSVLTMTRVVLAGATGLAVIAAGVGMLATLTVSARTSATTAAADPALGRTLWQGRAPLQARLAGEGADLAPAQARCAACHALPSPEGGGALGDGPMLESSRLVRPMSRRGGKVSRYDEAAFCRLLRSGLDPAANPVSSRMPRYEIAAADCASLWQAVLGAGDISRRS